MSQWTRRCGNPDKEYAYHGSIISFTMAVRSDDRLSLPLRPAYAWDWAGLWPSCRPATTRPGTKTYRKMAKFWGKLFLINFAIGVVTGIVQEFQFGMNWSEYSRFVGDIFGAPLAIEALMAFFLESTFLGVWIFGEGKVPEKVHLASIWLVAIGSNLSRAVDPAGQRLDAAPGRLRHRPGHRPSDAEGFLCPDHQREGLDLLLAHHFGRSGDGQLPDPRASAPTTWSASRMWRSSKRSFQMAAVVGSDRRRAGLPGRDIPGQFMYETQPMKMASIEAHLGNLSNRPLLHPHHRRPDRQAGSLVVARSVCA